MAYIYIYILQSLVNNRYYVGSTIDLQTRLEEHNLGKSPYTRNSGPWKLVFSHEYSTLQEARKIEFKLKKQKSRKIIDKIVSNQEVKLRS